MIDKKKIVQNVFQKKLESAQPLTATPPPKPQPKKMKKPQPVKTFKRLPSGSMFVAAYDDDKQLWTGTLTIREGSDTGHVCIGTARAIFTLLSKLDGQFRRWKWEQKQKEVLGQADVPTVE